MTVSQTDNLEGIGVVTFGREAYLEFQATPVSAGVEQLKEFLGSTIHQSGFVLATSLLPNPQQKWILVARETGVRFGSVEQLIGLRFWVVGWSIHVF